MRTLRSPFVALLTLLCASAVSAALLGITLGFPAVTFLAGTTHYDASSGLFSVETTPVRFRLSPAHAPVTVDPIPNVGEALSIVFQVDGAGALIGGPAGPDLSLVGQVDIPGEGFFSGVLLEGEITAFGFRDSGTSTDDYDMIFSITGGELAGLFAGFDLGVSLNSESSSFTGSFAVDFSGEAKGTLGTVPAVGMLGDLVFEDLDGDGLQCRDGIDGPFDGVCQAEEPLDPGIPDVLVTIESICDDPGDEIVPGAPGSTLRTDATGFYKFMGLPTQCKYTVNVDPCNFDATPGATCSDGGPGGALEGLDPTVPQAGDDICTDSGGLDEFGAPVTDMAMTFLPVDPTTSEQTPLNDPCLDFGYVRPGECVVDVDLTCCVPTPPAPRPPFDCGDAKPITNLTLFWDGPSGVDLETEGGQVITDIQNGDQVVIQTADLGNDVDLFLSGAVSGTSRFHVSCSDDAMNGPEDCGSRQGNSKNDESGFVNDWLFEGMGGENGALVCTPPDAELEGTQCRAPGGSTGDDCQGKVTEAVFEYTGEDSCAISNTQEGKATCVDAGFAGGAAVSIEITKDEDKIFANPDTGIGVGDRFSVRKFENGAFKELASETKFDVIDANGRQQLALHTSCSKALNVGDQFGSVRLVELTTTEGGTVTEPDPDAPIFNQACSVRQAPAPPHCTTKVLTLMLRYVGGDCTISNPQEGKAECTGSDPGDDVSIVITKDEDHVSAFPSAGIQVGDTFAIDHKDDGELHSDTKFEATGSAGSQAIEIHTSCSKPLNLGDRFGAFEVVAMDRKDDGLVSLGAQIEYQYKISNPNAHPLTVTSVFDDHLDELLDDPIVLGPGEMTTLFQTTTLEESRESTVFVDGLDGPDGTTACEAQDSVEVELTPPPPAPFVCSDAKPITHLMLIWNGPSGVHIEGEAGQVITDIQNGEEVVIDTFDLGNDVDLILSGSVVGTSRFHVSCSDGGMNGPEDCGTAQGNSKGDDPGLVNLWLLEGMGGSLTLDCSAL